MRIKDIVKSSPLMAVLGIVGFDLVVEAGAVVDHNVRSAASIVAMLTIVIDVANVVKRRNQSDFAWSRPLARLAATFLLLQLVLAGTVRFAPSAAALVSDLVLVLSAVILLVGLPLSLRGSTENG